MSEEKKAANVDVMSEAEVRELVCKFYSAFQTTRYIEGFGMSTSTFKDFMEDNINVRPSTIKKIATNLHGLPVDWDKIEVKDELKKHLFVEPPKPEESSSITSLEQHIQRNQLEEIRQELKLLRDTVDAVLDRVFFSASCMNSIHQELTGKAYMEDVQGGYVNEQH